MASLHDLYQSEGGEQWNRVAEGFSDAIATAYVTSNGNPRMRKILVAMITEGWDHAKALEDSQNADAK